ncbi:MAG: HEAT repeat domain-containing protein [Thermoanaerobaculia bacterium]
MSECDVVRERMPELLVEALDAPHRESAHVHIEGCSACEREWSAYRETWRAMGGLPDVPVPDRVRDGFLSSLGLPAAPNVVPFHRRPSVRWISQAAAVAVLVGGSFWAGRTRPSGPLGPTPMDEAEITAVQLAGSHIVPASRLSPVIEGAPRIDNVRLLSAPAESDVRLAFEVTSQWTVTGGPEDESMATLLAYLVQAQGPESNSRSTAIQLIRDGFGAGHTASPAIARALAGVLETETNEGVRLNAMDALKELPAAATAQAQAALIEVLKNDPNPAVRLKAVEALANVARGGSPLDPAMVETLRQKAGQDDEILYVRVKAAEALSQIDL